MQNDYLSECFWNAYPDGGLPLVANSVMPGTAMAPVTTGLYTSAVLTDVGICVGMRKVNINCKSPSYLTHRKEHIWPNNLVDVRPINNYFGNATKNLYPCGDYPRVGDHLSNGGLDFHFGNQLTAPFDTTRHYQPGYFSNFRTYLLPQNPPAAAIVTEPSPIPMQDILPLISSETNTVHGPFTTPQGDRQGLVPYPSGRRHRPPCEARLMSSASKTPPVPLLPSSALPLSPVLFSPETITAPTDRNAVERCLIRNCHVAAPKKKWIQHNLMSKCSSFAIIFLFFFLFSFIYLIMFA